MDEEKNSSSLVDVLAEAEFERHKFEWAKVACAEVKLYVTANNEPVGKESEVVKLYLGMSKEQQENFINLMFNLSRGEEKGYTYREGLMAFNALFGISQAYIVAEQPLPVRLGQWLFEVGAGRIERPEKKKRGRPRKNQHRDAAIVETIKNLRDIYGLPVSHNKASEKEQSASHILAKIFNLAHSTVVDIWEKSGKNSIP